MKKLYVGNLPFSVSEDDLRELFGKHGTVYSVTLITDRETGRPRGFGFIEMDDNAVQPAIAALNGFELEDRPLKVNEAQDRPKRSGGFGRGGGSRGGGGGGRKNRW